MPIAEKLTLARRSQPGRLTQAAVAALLNMKEERYQSYERGIVKGRKTLGPIVDELARLWNIPKDWFWDGSPSDPYVGNVPAALAREVKVRMYHVAEERRVYMDDAHSEFVAIDADVAQAMAGFGAYEVPDDRMEPRFKAGWRIFSSPGRRPKIGLGYIGLRKGNANKPDELLIGVYVYRDEIFYLEPKRRPEMRVKTADLESIRLIVACQEVLGGNGNWVRTEKNIVDGLPMDLPATGVEGYVVPFKR